MGQDNCKPQPGDLIEIDRPRHKHWALYMGNGYVINLTPVGKQLLKAGMHTVPVFIRKVKKQRLEEVVQKNAWCVNNESDQYHCPLPAEEIICRAKNYINKDFTYHGFGSNCERFVKKLRYGEAISDQLRALLCGEMHVLNRAEDKDFPNPGDLIEIKRGSYEHWALYLGKGHVIHVTNVQGDTSTSPSSGSVFLRRAIVSKEELEMVAGNDTWCVNNKYDCYRSPFPMEEIIRRAVPYIDKELPYRLFLKNCEHFVTMLRYGDGVSEQAKAALQNINSISSVVTAGVGFVSLAVAAGIPVVGLPLLASAAFGAVGGGSLIATIGLTSSNIARSVSFAQFQKAGRYILEQSCC
ncbi:uncharacterized protein LOC132077812 [Ammospiza nelsoni]|uniref:uncharacterized protein LOC132077812 n=1 Tax=Ammospiza nelsoni TaxID=2857394 RepID=UPI0028698ABE|nr:uncharacterized protein LOC132077812 [Ammospiza nelsoni]XP_059335693.1 uncharacterized protein LOC132077812 [Ammospiza nelsoni]